MASKVPDLVESGRLKKTRQTTLDRHAEWWELRRQGYTLEYIAARFDVSFQAVSKAMAAMEQKLYEVLAKEAAPIKARQTAILEANLERALLEWERSKENAETERIVEKTLGKTETSEEPQPHGGALLRRRTQNLREEIDEIDLEGIPGYFYDKDGEEVPSELRPRIVADFLLKKMEQGGDVDGLIERTVTRTSDGRCGDPRFLAEIRAALSDIRKIWGLDAPTKQELTGKDGNPISVFFADSLSRVYGSESEGA
jgi:transposase